MLSPRSRCSNCEYRRAIFNEKELEKLMGALCHEGIETTNRVLRRALEDFAEEGSDDKDMP